MTLPFFSMLIVPFPACSHAIVTYCDYKKSQIFSNILYAMVSSSTSDHRFDLRPKVLQNDAR